MSDSQHVVHCFTDKITVEAWVESTHSVGEGLQALVSKWTPRESFDGFAAFDASCIDGHITEGYFGAVFDGQYVYFVPEHAKSVNWLTHAVVLRYDTQAPFEDKSSYAAYDAQRTSGLDTRGYYGGAFDGRYVYFIPRQINLDYYHTRLLRYDTHGDFKDDNSWSAFDIGEAQSAQSCAFDGRHLYLCPGFYGDPKIEDQESGTVIRYDTKSTFTDRASYQSFDLKADFGERAACFDGAVFDGRYVYFVPLQNEVMVRYDTHSAFDAATSWQAFDGRQISASMYVGAVFDGQHVYFVPYSSGRVLRFDTSEPFDDAKSWQVYDASQTDELRTDGFDGGHFDGRYVYFVPFLSMERDGSFFMHGNYLRYDATKPFDDSSSWQSVDASQTNGIKSFGYNAGAYDGKYFYCAPWRRGNGRTSETVGIHGTVLRCNTLGDGSFSLRFCDYGHNGGLCAAVPGPSFIVNTEEGHVIYVAANRVLPPGRNHIKGTYDGAIMKLIINGEIVAQRKASGRIQNSSSPVTVGEIENGLGRFRGRMESACVLNTVEQ